jgi:hypothetical protein
MARYHDTIEKPVVFQDHAAVIPPGDMARLTELFPVGRASMWGVVPGKGNVNVGQYQDVQVGDLVMFGGGNKYFACGTVAYLQRNAALAEALWGRYVEDQTWEYMYVLDEIRPLDIPYAEFNAVASYDLGAVPQGFRVLGEQKSLAILQHFPLLSERHVPPASEQEYEDALATLTGDLDRTVEASQRAEQAYLRRALFSGPHARCDLCGRQFEIEFLVAAHIKRRAACTDSERRDVRHVIMAACKFGCDELYERGYITINSDGVLQLSMALQAGGQAHSYAAGHLAGKTFGRAMAGPEDYFGWHRTHAYRG